MLSAEFNVDEFLSSVGTDVAVRELSPTEIAIRARELDTIQEGRVDYRIRQLSYSSLLLLHSCPRKFELYKSRTEKTNVRDEEAEITFAFGHVVGEAIQLVMDNRPKTEIVWRMFLGWHADLMAENSKKSKSFWDAMIALERFIAMRNSGFLEEYELVYYQGKPAIELSFCIILPDGFRLRGYVDAVLRHKVTGEILVLECKTTGTRFSPAQYKNSSQAIGYSVVLDVLFPELSSYEVLYLIYQTTDQTYNPIPFAKSYSQRAQWIKELLLDVEMIKMYAEQAHYPQHGESCFAFFKECDYINLCTLSNQHLIPEFNPEKHIDLEEYQINLSLLDLVEAQLKKTVTPMIEKDPEDMGEML